MYNIILRRKIVSVVDHKKNVKSLFAFSTTVKITPEVIETARAKMEQFATDHKFKDLTEWHNVSSEILGQIVGRTAYQKFRQSPLTLFSTVYPNSTWLPWKFNRVPALYWNDPSNQRKFIEWAENELNIKEKSDWYRVSYTEINKMGAFSLLELHSHSIYTLLSAIYPDYEWLPWKFSHTPSFFWHKKENQKRFLEWVAKELNIKEREDWYKVTRTVGKLREISEIKEIDALGGGEWLTRRDINLPKILSEFYPDYEWLPWKFAHCPNNFWGDVKNQRKFLEWAGKELGIKEMSDWYRVQNRDLEKLGAYALLTIYQYRISSILLNVFPEYEWLPWKFGYIPRKFWETVENKRMFIEWAGKQLGIKEMSDWYRVSRKELEDLGCVILKNTPVYNLLSTVYPDYFWLPWKFPVATWDESSVNKQFVEWAGKELNIKELKDWYRIKNEQLIDLGGGFLLIKYQSLFHVLSIMYPEFPWKQENFSSLSDIWTNPSLANYFVAWLQKQNKSEVSYIYRIVEKKGPSSAILVQALKFAFPKLQWPFHNKSAKKSQYMLQECLTHLFPHLENIEMLQEFRHPDLVNLELDYFFPQFNLAFEYQGIQHYRNVKMFNSVENVDSFQNRDQIKTELCKQKGITLIEVPFWWDRKLSSLAATVYNARPDMFPTQPQGTPIPSTRPELDSKDSKPVKKLLMTLTEWDESMDPTGWYMTEKYDGMRLYWNGNQFYTRQGEKVPVPELVARGFSSTKLDGELWTQYGLFQDAISMVKNTNEEKWNKAIFWVFDCPEVNKPLEERIEFLQKLNLPQFAKIVDFVKCESREHLKQFYDQVIAKGGEGIVLREPGSFYKPGRSYSIRKFKPFFDTEVKVTKNQYPHGFTCQQPNGKSLFVNIPQEQAEFAKQIKNGTIITIKHSGVNVHGTYLFPQFYRERTDIKWNDIVDKNSVK